MTQVIKLKAIAYAEEHGNRTAEWHFGPPPTEKTICNWQVSKEELRKMTIFRDFKDQFGFINKEFFFSLTLQSNKNSKMLFFLIA